MALTLIKEDGTGKSDANSYAAVADGDAYHDGHLYATDWTGASSTTKAAALVMVTRLIDAYFQFRSYKAHDAQALQWPREFARDDDALRSHGLSVLVVRDEYFASNAVPKLLLDATIETTRELIKSNRTDDPDGEGLVSMALTGTLSMTFDKKDTVRPSFRTSRKRCSRSSAIISNETPRPCASFAPDVAQPSIPDSSRACGRVSPRAAGCS